VSSASDDPVRFEKLLARRDALGELPGWRVRAEILALDRILRVFLANMGQLLIFLAKHAEPETAVRLWDTKRRKEFDAFLNEVDRLLHNYLAAATSGVRDVGKPGTTTLGPTSGVPAPNHRVLSCG
jgi:hypothetical protein